MWGNGAEINCKGYPPSPGVSGGQELFVTREELFVKELFNSKYPDFHRMRPMDSIALKLESIFFVQFVGVEISLKDQDKGC